MQFLSAPPHGATVSANEVQLQLNESIFLSPYSAWLDNGDPPEILGARKIRPSRLALVSGALTVTGSADREL